MADTTGKLYIQNLTVGVVQWELPDFNAAKGGDTAASQSPPAGRSVSAWLGLEDVCDAVPPLEQDQVCGTSVIVR